MSRRFNMTPSTDSSQAQSRPYKPRSMWVRVSGPHPVQAASCWHVEGPLRVETREAGGVTLAEKRGTPHGTPQVVTGRLENEPTRTRQLDHAASVQTRSCTNTTAILACTNS